jgi:hypothetical protein
MNYEELLGKREKLRKYFLRCSPEQQKDFGIYLMNKYSGRIHQLRLQTVTDTFPVLSFYELDEAIEWMENYRITEKERAINVIKKEIGL